MAININAAVLLLNASGLLRELVGLKSNPWLTSSVLRNSGKVTLSSLEDTAGEVTQYTCTCAGNTWH